MNISMNQVTTALKKMFDPFNWFPRSAASTFSVFPKQILPIKKDGYIMRRKSANKQKKDGAKQLKKILDSMDEVFFSVDMIAFKVIHISKTCEKLYGYTPADFINNYLLWFEIIHPDDKHILADGKHIFESEEGELKRGDQITNEYRIIHKDKNIRWLESKIIPSWSKKGNLVRVDGVARDITERKKAESELLKVSHRLQLATYSAKVGIWDLNVVNNVLFWDEGIYRLYGVKSEDFPGPHEAWESGLHPDDLARVRNEVEMAILGKKEYDTEFRIEWPDKSIHYIKANASVYRDESGKALRMIGTNWDITESKVAEKALHLAQFTVDNATHAIYWIKPDGSFYNFNKAAHLMLGYTYNELMQLSVPDIDPFYNRAMWPIHWDDLRSKRSVTLTTKQCRKDGKLIDVQVDAHFFTVDNLEMNCAFVYDITERRINEELLEKSEASLAIKIRELEQKNKELEQFAYVASHDMQEPLRTTSSFVELLQRQYQGKLDENADKYFQFIAQSSDRMRVLIKDLLDYSRIGRKREWEQVDCNAVLEEVAADLTMAIKEAGAEIIIHPLPVINGYPTEIKQLFQNLLTNAIKFQKKNTCPRVNISVHESKGYWEFKVEDNGIGIEEKYRERIFIIFQRLHTRTDYEGSGIGLAHCKKIVELHGGKIWVESTEGEGTTFYFTIRQNIS